MKTNVARTSIRAYDALKQGAMGNQHASIVAQMEPGRLYTRREIAGITRLETSAVAGRVHELIDEGRIVSAGSVKCPITGRTVEAVKLAEKQAEH